MPERFTVDACYQIPCHWTPRPTLASGLDNILDDLPTLEIQTEELDGNKPIPGSYGEHQVNRRDKRVTAPEPLPPPTPVNESRSGPPLPEWPSDNEMGEPKFTKGKSQKDVDQNIQKLAVDRQQATKVAEKIIDRPASFYHFMDTRYILRPEAIESVFYMWRITGDPIWQEKGWNMWKSIEKATWTELAYSGISDVNDANSTQTDSMERYDLSKFY